MEERELLAIIVFLGYILDSQLRLIWTIAG